MKIALLTVFILLIAALVFNFYKKRQRSATAAISTEDRTFDNYANQKLLELVNKEYPDLAFKLQGDTIIAKNGMGISAKVVNHRTFPSSESFQINFFTSHPFLSKSIEERLAGIGETDTAALQNGVRSFLAGQFPVIADAIGLKHSPELDFDIIGEKDKSHWHTLHGDIQLQGELSRNYDSSIYDKTYSLLKPVLLEKIRQSNQDFHWFRYYISKAADGQIIGDCYFDNEPCAEGLELLKKYALAWPSTEKFAGQKQFLMFRKCAE